MEDSFLGENKLEHQSFKLNKKIYLYTVGVFGFLAIGYFLFFSAPLSFPVNSSIKIESGTSLRGASFLLKKEKIIRSRVAFEFFVIIFGGDRGIQSANYFFEKKIPVYKVAWRIQKGEHNMAPVTVTIPEGFDISQIADTFDLKLDNFDKVKFLTEAKNQEGYLFPDTYFFLTTDDEAVVLKSMQDNFEKKVTPLLSQIIASGKNEKEIIVMASIIEREAKGEGDREVISGILWRRIAINMPLQVDAAMDTYKKRGLPETPICNPGLDAIKAAIYPKESPYLYYLHDQDGNIHYAKNFAEHQANIKKYLIR